MQEELIGTVDHFIFQCNENGFAVFVLLTPRNNKVTVTSNAMLGVHAGHTVMLQGNWQMHPKFGKQFNATQCSITQPTTINELKKYLGSGLIKGIGPKYAEKIVDHFGTQTLTIIDENPARLNEVSGIGAHRVKKIMTAWLDQKAIAHIMIFLQEKNISPAYAGKIYKKYGAASIAVVNENPYRLADEIWGIGFKSADTIAFNLGFAKDSLKRISSGILFCITQATNNGHLYCIVSELKKQCINTLELEEFENKNELIKKALYTLYENEKIVLITHEEEHFITLPKYYYAEKGIAHCIKNLLQYPAKKRFNINTIYQSLRSKNRNIILNELQQTGVITALQEKITIITGGPGTGKTTLINTLLSILDDHHISYKLTAPTGRAAKRITESTKKNATTLHRLLEFDPSSFSFSRNERNALNLDFLIVDEASMIDTFLAHALFKSIPHAAHLILLGDIDQLPSVGPGAVLNNLIDSKQITTISLTEVFRQAQNSLITLNAHRINKGIFPTTQQLPDTKKDFLYIKEQKAEKVSAHLAHIFSKRLPKFGIDPKNCLVLTPMNRGSSGTVALNYNLQQQLNKPSGGIKKPHIIYHGITFQENDPVMQIRNNYDKFVFNGDMGTITKIDTVNRTVTVDFLGTLVSYEYSELDELMLAYAISIHKSQGSEYSAVIIPLFMQHFMLLQRNLLYTAITRAKKLCILIGDPRAIGTAINNNKSIKRLTFLTIFLTKDVNRR